MLVKSIAAGFVSSTIVHWRNHDSNDAAFTAPAFAAAALPSPCSLGTAGFLVAPPSPAAGGAKSVALRWRSTCVSWDVGTQMLKHTLLQYNVTFDTVCLTCRGTWARVIVDQFRHLALQSPNATCAPPAAF